MSDYEPPNVEGADAELPVPGPEYHEPDVTPQRVRAVDPPEYVPPYVHDDAAPAPAKSAKAEPKAEPKGKSDK